MHLNLCETPPWYTRSILRSHQMWIWIKLGQIFYVYHMKNISTINLNQIFIQLEITSDRIYYIGRWYTVAIHLFIMTFVCKNYWSSSRGLHASLSDVIFFCSVVVDLSFLIATTIPAARTMRMVPMATTVSIHMLRWGEDASSEIF